MKAYKKTWQHQITGLEKNARCSSYRNQRVFYIVFIISSRRHLFERLARERNITVEEMRAIISERIEEGGDDSNLGKRHSGEKFHVQEKCRHWMSG